MSKNKWIKHGVWLDLCPVRPDNHLKGDCSTRALSYAFDLPYHVIRGLQYRLAARLNTRFNSWKVIRRLLKLFNYVEYTFYYKMDCGQFAKHMEGLGFARPVIVGSSCHLNIADGGCVVDTWDSRSKRVTGAWVARDELGDDLPF